MVARGEEGRVWRLDTDMGAFAIKELIIRQTPADAVADVAYQETVLATGAVAAVLAAGAVLTDVCAAVIENDPEFSAGEIVRAM